MLYFSKISNFQHISAHLFSFHKENFSALLSMWSVYPTEGEFENYGDRWKMILHFSYNQKQKKKNLSSVEIELKFRRLK